MTENFVVRAVDIWTKMENHRLWGGNEKYLILPMGLVVLEEMLKEEFSAENNSAERVSLIFAHFKKEQGLQYEYKKAEDKNDSL